MTQKPSSDTEIAARLAANAARANAEAAERRANEQLVEKPAELGGPKGPEPTRYGDWERKGVLSDF